MAEWGVYVAERSGNLPKLLARALAAGGQDPVQPGVRNNGPRSSSGATQIAAQKAVVAIFAPLRFGAIANSLSPPLRPRSRQTMGLNSRRKQANGRIDFVLHPSRRN